MPSSRATSGTFAPPASLPSAWRNLRTICSGEYPLPKKSPPSARSKPSDSHSNWTEFRGSGHGTIPGEMVMPSSQNQENPDTFYAAGGGVFKSTEGDRSWHQSATIFPAPSRRWRPLRATRRSSTRACSGEPQRLCTAAKTAARVGGHATSLIAMFITVDLAPRTALFRRCPRAVEAHDVAFEVCSRSEGSILTDTDMRREEDDLEQETRHLVHDQATFWGTDRCS